MKDNQIPVKLLFTEFECKDTTVKAFASSGFENLGLPNLILVGNFRPSRATALMGCVVDNWLKAVDEGKTLPMGEVNYFKGSDDEELPAHLQRVNCRSKEVPKEIKAMLEEPGTINTPIVQIVWSDEFGAMPWDENFNKNFITLVLPSAEQTLN